MFHPGENILHRFIVPIAKYDIEKVYVSYKQDDHIICIKELPQDGMIKDGEEDSETILEVVLTEQDSLLFADKMDFKIQLNIVTVSGSRHVSAEVKGKNGVQHIREVITDD